MVSGFKIAQCYDFRFLEFFQHQQVAIAGNQERCALSSTEQAVREILIPSNGNLHSSK
jgi:hypothetical protein